MCVCIRVYGPVQVALRRIVTRAPSIMSLSLSGDVKTKVDYFVGEMGLERIEVAKIFTLHPRASRLYTCTYRVQCAQSKVLISEG